MSRPASTSTHSIFVRPSAIAAASRSLVALGAALVLAACGGEEPLEGADSAGGFIPNASGANAPANYDPDATGLGPDSTLGVVQPRTGQAAPSGDTLSPDIQRNNPVSPSRDTIRSGRPPRP